MAPPSVSPIAIAKELTEALLAETADVAVKLKEIEARREEKERIQQEASQGTTTGTVTPSVDTASTTTMSAGEDEGEAGGGGGEGEVPETADDQPQETDSAHQPLASPSSQSQPSTTRSLFDSNSAQSSGVAKPEKVVVQPPSYKPFKHFLELSLSTKDTLELCLNGKAELVRLFEACQGRFARDANIGIMCCVAIANLTSHSDCKEHFDPNVLLATVLNAVKSFPLEKKIVHLACMTIVNIGEYAHLSLTEEAADRIVATVAPLYQEGPVVEAWCCALCNLTAYRRRNKELLVGAGAIETVERLLLFHGDNGRVIHRGLQALTNLSTTFVPRKSNKPRKKVAAKS